MGKVYMKSVYKRIAKQAFEDGVSYRNPIHLLCWLRSNLPEVFGSHADIDRAKALYFEIFNDLKEYEARQLGYTSEASRLYAEALGKTNPVGETISMYV